MLSFSKNNRYRIAVEKWTIDIASLWKLTIAEVYATVCTHTIMNRKWHEDLARILANANSVYALFVFAFFFTYFYICFCHHRYEDLTRILTTQLCCFFAFLFLYLPFKCFCISFCHHLYEDLARILAYATCLQPANFDCALLFLYLSLKCFCICFCHHLYDDICNFVCARTLCICISVFDFVTTWMRTWQEFWRMQPACCRQPTRGRHPEKQIVAAEIQIQVK